MQERIEQPAARLFSSGQARFELIANGHQFIDLCDDALLLGPGRQRYDKIAKWPKSDCWLRGAGRAASSLIVQMCMLSDCRCTTTLRQVRRMLRSLQH